MQAFIDPRIIASDVVNIVVVTPDNNYRHSYFQQILLDSIFASYYIKITSRFPASAYSTQLIDCVRSGLFTKNLQVNAKAMGASGFSTASSIAVQIGKYSVTLILQYKNMTCL